MKNLFVFLTTVLITCSLFTSCKTKPDTQYKVIGESGETSIILAWEIDGDNYYDVGDKVYYCIGGIDASVRIYDPVNVVTENINGKPVKLVYTGLDGWQPVHYGQIVSKKNL